MKWTKALISSAPVYRSPSNLWTSPQVYSSSQELEATLLQEELPQEKRTTKPLAWTIQLPNNMYCVYILFKTKELFPVSKTGLVGKSHWEVTWSNISRGILIVRNVQSQATKYYDSHQQMCLKQRLDCRNSDFKVEIGINEFKVSFQFPSSIK